MTNFDQIEPHFFYFLKDDSQLRGPPALAGGDLETRRRPADCQSATQQAASLRYECAETGKKFLASAVAVPQNCFFDGGDFRIKLNRFSLLR